MSIETAGKSRATGTVSPPVHGEYLCTDRDLYFVEQVSTERVVLEDCRTGTLVDVPIADITKLRPISPATGPA